MNKKAKTFLFFVIVIGIIILGISIHKVFLPHELNNLLYWILLAGLCQSFLVFFDNNRYVSVVFAVIFAVQLIYGVYYSVIIAAGSQIFFIAKEKPSTYRHVFNTPLYKILFNVANYSISAYVSGLLLNSLELQYHLNVKMISFVILMIVYILIFALINTGILMMLMSFLNKEPFLKLWKKILTWIIPHFLAIASLGYFIALFYIQDMGKLYIILLIGPLLLARHSFQLYQNSQVQYYKTIKALTATLEAKDSYTEGHSRRVEMHAGNIAREMGLSETRIQCIEVAALLHDIGKIGIEDSVLNKKDSLTESEWKQIHNHPTIGIKILEDIELPGKAKMIIKHHHEKYDGSGYPDGLKGDEVPVEAYILSAADAYDAMTSHRPYRDAMDANKAMSILMEGKGSHFHPKVVDAFMKVLSTNTIKEEVTD